jgi:hypothetical protein
MRKLISVLLCGAFATAFSLSAAAGGPGGGAPGGRGASAPGGPPAGSQALQNSNGRFAKDRDKGLDRAEDRMSAQGLKHQKATDAQKKRRKPGPEESSAGSTK